MEKFMLPANHINVETSLLSMSWDWILEICRWKLLILAVGEQINDQSSPVSANCVKSLKIKRPPFKRQFIQLTHETSQVSVSHSFGIGDYLLRHDSKILDDVTIVIKRLMVR